MIQASRRLTVLADAHARVPGCVVVQHGRNVTRRLAVQWGHNPVGRAPSTLQVAGVGGVGVQLRGMPSHHGDVNVRRGGTQAALAAICMLHVSGRPCSNLAACSHVRCMGHKHTARRSLRTLLKAACIAPCKILCYSGAWHVPCATCPPPAAHLARLQHLCEHGARALKATGA